MSNHPGKKNYHRPDCENKDTARLDWLDANKYEMTTTYVPSMAGPMWQYQGVSQPLYFDDIRDAIDRAMCDDGGT